MATKRTEEIKSLIASAMSSSKAAPCGIYINAAWDLLKEIARKDVALQAVLTLDCDWLDDEVRALCQAALREEAP